MKTSIVIVDDHVMIAQALQSIIANFKSFEVLYECQNGKELQEKFENEVNIPDVVLLDISMPIMDGFETAKWLKAKHPNLLILVLSMQDDEDSLLKMVSNGAKGYLLKNAHPKELEKALITLVKQGSYYPNWVTSKLCNNLMKLQKVDSSNLSFSEREKEFLKLSSTELTYKEIAEKMCCSPRTIEGYRDALCEKLDVKGRIGLAVFAVKNSFVY